ncbi:Uncharacterized protein FWK35_00021939, partial [Aphis craccivora]
PNDILIISDSLSTLLSLKKICPKNEITSNTQAILIQTRKNIEFMWVPSRTGIVGNEKADNLATNSFQNPTINNVPTNDI